MDERTRHSRRGEAPARAWLRSALIERQRWAFKLGWHDLGMSGFESEQHKREVWRAHRDALCAGEDSFGLTSYGYGDGEP